MTKIVVNIVNYFVSAALGLLAAAWLVNGFNLSVQGFFLGTVMFAVSQSVLAPLVSKLADKYAEWLKGGIGLVSTFLALLVANLVSGGITISGVSAWIIGTLVVWLIAAFSAWLLSVLAKKWILTEKKANS